LATHSRRAEAAPASTAEPHALARAAMLGAMEGLGSESGDAPPAPGMFKKVLEGAKALLGNKMIMTQMFGTLRVLTRSAFNPLEFSKPADRTECLHRVRTNGYHYRHWYSIVFLGCTVYTILSSPLLLFGMLMLLGAWLYAFVLTAPDAIMEVAGFQLKRRERLLVLVPFSILVVTLTGMINSLLYVVVLSSLVSLPHASFHTPAEFDELDALELEGLAPTAFT
jgi:hypothetical protein